MSSHRTSTPALGLISTGLVLGMDFSVRHMTSPNRTMNSREPTPCQSVPNCWTFSAKDCFGGWAEVAFRTAARAFACLAARALAAASFDAECEAFSEDAGADDDALVDTSLPSAGGPQLLTPVWPFDKADRGPLQCLP